MTRFAVLCFALLTFAFAIQAGAEDRRARELYGPSPHGESGDCSICHMASPDMLRAWYVWGSTKRQLKDDPTTLCVRCHGTGFGHATGLRSPLNRAGLPLNPDGTINCALTCHDMHVTEGDELQLQYHLRHANVKLCTSCHDK